MSQQKTQQDNNSLRSRMVSEFNYLKIAALILLIFVHTDLLFAYPNIMNPIQWFMLSAFFFISGFLAYESFLKRKKSLSQFFQSKALHIYVPFAAAAIFYFLLEVALGAQLDPLRFFPVLSMVNIFDSINAVYNWGSFWFIPYLLLFMLIICVLEKYVKRTRWQLPIIFAIWLCSLLLWSYNSAFRLGGNFSQYLLVFAFGFYVHKLNLYEKLMRYRMALIFIPLAAFSEVDLGVLFNYSTPLNAFEALLYFNIRSFCLTMGFVLIALLFLRTSMIPKNGFAKQVASRSAYIYLMEPFISFLILTYIFGEGENFFAGGVMFYLYQATRIVVLLVLVPLAFMGWNKFRHRKTVSSVGQVGRHDSSE